MDHYRTIIVGGGPAGLFCGARCSSGDCRTLILEKGNRVGKKLLITGSGHCNFTHAGEIYDFFHHYGPHGKFLRPALRSFSNNDLIGYFNIHGVSSVTDEGGKVFPASMHSRDILDVLVRGCDEAGARIRCNEPVIQVVNGPGSFEVITGTARYSSEFLVISTGGASYPATGSSGDGYRLSASLGHTIITPAPALTPVSIRDFAFSGLSGISFPGMAFSLWRKGKKVADCQGDVLITHTGLSGPGILDNSRLMMSGDEIRLSFVKGLNREAFSRQVSRQVQEEGSRRIGSLLSSYQVPGRIVRRILEISGIAQDATGAHITASQRKRLVSVMTGFPLTISSPGDFSVAMATRGGVSLSEVDAGTMESLFVHNLFFAGEVLDIDGDTGGYNLQAAFSTGRLAGECIRKRGRCTESPHRSLGADCSPEAR